MYIQAGSAAFLATTISLPQGSNAFIQVYTGLTGRRLLNVRLLICKGYILNDYLLCSLTFEVNLSLPLFFEFNNLTIGLDFPGTNQREQCIWPMVRMDDGCYIYGRPNPSNLLKCKQ